MRGIAGRPAIAGQFGNYVNGYLVCSIWKNTSVNIFLIIGGNYEHVEANLNKVEIFLGQI